jgi:agmatinase
VGKTRQSIHDAVAAVVRAGAFPVVLGGDHYITFPAFTGFAGHFVRSSGAALYSAPEIRRMGIRRTVEEGIARATDGADLLYVTIDIDVVDPALAPGTGAINFGGITPMELLEAVELLKRAPVGAIDLVEVAPQWDPAGVTERLAPVALVNFVGHRLAAPPGP